MIRQLLAALTAALLLLGGVLVAAGTAAAHSTPTGSVPENGATLDTGPTRVSVTFNEDLQPSFPSLTLVGPDGNLWSKGSPTVEGKTVSIEVGELGPAGEYTLAYRVTSADGHPVSGTRIFTLSTAGNGVPGPKPATMRDTGAGGDSDRNLLWLFIGGAVVLFAGGLAFALYGGRSRKPRQ